MKKHDYSTKRHLKRPGIVRGLLAAVLVLYSITATAHAQQTTLDVDFNGNTLEQVISFLKENTNYDFVYRKGMLPADTRVNLTLQDATVEEILSRSLPQGLSFAVSNNVVVINRTPAQQEQEQEQVQPQTANRFSVSGTVYEARKDGTRAPLPYVAVVVEGLSLHAVTDANGQFVINNVPRGQATLNISMLGKIPVTRELNVTENVSLQIVMEEDNFRVQDVVVTATNSKAGEATSSVISRTAIDHLQATSLMDILSLLPGNMMQNQNLNNTGVLTLRSLPTTMRSSEYQITGDAVDMNAMGVSVIMDGAPISNNANMQALNPTGGVNTVPGGGAASLSSIDARGISTDNIESVEVITGIPSVQYGDVTSGVIVINSKAGRSPLRINARTNINTYLFSADAGTGLGENSGFLNYGIEYTHNVNDPTAAHVFYDRATAKFLYSNTFFDGRLNTTSSLDLSYRRDKRKYSKDDTQQQRGSHATDKGIRLTTRGTYDMGLGWWRNIQYSVSVDYHAKDGYEKQKRPELQLYSPAMNDGEVVSNLKGIAITDADGNVIAPAGDTYLRWFPSSYRGHYNIKGRELNIFGKLSTVFAQSGERINNQILVGADIRYAGNPGTGKTFDADSAFISYSGVLNNGVRPRSFKDIKGYTNFGGYVENTFRLTFLRGREFTLQAGIRYDNVSVAGSLLSPRFNASLDIVPRVLSIRGGYGVTGKMPSLLMIRPEAAYFDYINFNNYPNSNIPAADKRAIVTTRVFDTQNKDLEIAKNAKTEVGIDLRLGGNTLRVVGFRERMDNGYKMERTIDRHNYTSFDNYAMVDGEFVLSSVQNVFLGYNTTTNNLVLNSDGIEFDLSLKRFDAIRTSLSINGQWIKTETYYNGYTFYNSSGGIDATKSIGIYDKGWTKNYFERLLTTFRATHNIPQLGFVVTLTAQVTWLDKDWRKIGRDIPIEYMSVEDGKIYDFPYHTREEALASDFRNMVRSSDEKYLIVEDLPPLVCFHINVTKEIGDWARVSFLANNMFRSYPRVKSDRNSTTYITRNPKFFFGVELSMTIK